MNWFAETRQNWIVEMLQIYGFINREHLMRKFGISEVQASKDLNHFMRERPHLMAYDLTRKTYVAKK